MFQPIKTITRAVRQFLEDESLEHAAALAFNMLLAFVPLLTVCLTVLTAFPSFRGFKTQISSFITSHLVSDFAGTIQTHFNQFIGQAHHLSIAGSLLLLATAILMIFNLEKAFNRIWRVSKGRHSMVGILLYWGVLTLLPLLLGSSIMLTHILTKRIATTHFLPRLLTHNLLLAIPYSMTWIAFSLLYLALPHCKVERLPAILGGFMATLLFKIAQYGFSLYIHYFPSYQFIYGAIAAIPLFLIWLYLSLAITLFGATIAHVLQRCTPRAKMRK